MTNLPRRTLFKIGGSLLDLPDLRERLQQLVDLRPGRAIALLVGGGEAANLVRKWDRRFQLGDRAAHWLAIDAIGLNARLLPHLLSAGRLVREIRELEAVFESGRIAILDPAPLLGELESPPLPESWEVTSDTIAAHLAGPLGFAELVLAKSCEPAAEAVERLMDCGQVDALFPQAVRTLSHVGWVNLRAEQLQIRPVRLEGDR